MPFARPTLQQLFDRIRADITANMSGKASLLKRSWVSILARAIAGGFHLLYGYIAWAVKQLFMESAEKEYAESKAAVYAIYPHAPEYAAGMITLPAGTQGAAIPALTAWKRSDGVRYFSNGPQTMGPGVTDVAVTAEFPGSNGNLSEGSELQIESPLAGVPTLAAVKPGSLGIYGGFDQETDSSVRARYFQRVQNPPHGGSKADYEGWALEVPGVAAAFVYGPKDIQEDPPLPPFGYVWVFIMALADDPTPSQPLMDAVKAYLDTKKSLTARVVVLPLTITYTPLTIEIGLKAGYAIEQAQLDIEAELDDLFEREAVPNTSLRVSDISAAISGALSVDFHRVITPAADVPFGPTVIGKPGTVTLIPV